jgi:hypothetical protein
MNNQGLGKSKALTLAGDLFEAFFEIVAGFLLFALDLFL